jgi:hypothetical protein
MLKKRFPVLVAATVIAVIGGLSVAAPAQAAPGGCRDNVAGVDGTSFRPCSTWYSTRTVDASIPSIGIYTYAFVPSGDSIQYAVFVDEWSGPGGTLLNSWLAETKSCPTSGPSGYLCFVDSWAKVSNLPNNHYYNVSIRYYYVNGIYHWIDAQSPLMYMSDCVPNC